MINSGDILRQFRSRRFRTAKEAHRAIKLSGCDISYQQYSRLERGFMPSSREHLVAVCDTIGITPNCWFTGASEEDRILGALSPRMKKMFAAMALAVRSDLKDMGCWDR